MSTPTTVNQTNTINVATPDQVGPALKGIVDSAQQLEDSLDQNAGVGQ